MGTDAFIGQCVSPFFFNCHKTGTKSRNRSRGIWKRKKTKKKKKWVCSFSSVGAAATEEYPHISLETLESPSSPFPPQLLLVLLLFPKPTSPKPFYFRKDPLPFFNLLEGSPLPLSRISTPPPPTASPSTASSPARGRSSTRARAIGGATRLPSRSRFSSSRSDCRLLLRFSLFHRISPFVSS